jgi:hypothetical protein
VTPSSSAIEAARSGVSLKGVYLETLSWAEAEPLLRSDPLIVAAAAVSG